jgi:SAM-dependent methyltransferase
LGQKHPEEPAEAAPEQPEPAADAAAADEAVAEERDDAEDALELDATEDGGDVEAEGADRDAAATEDSDSGSAVAERVGDAAASQAAPEPGNDESGGPADTEDGPDRPRRSTLPVPVVSVDAAEDSKDGAKEEGDEPAGADKRVIFSLDDGKGTAPLAAVFKRRKGSGRARRKRSDSAITMPLRREEEPHATPIPSPVRIASAALSAPVEEVQRREAPAASYDHLVADAFRNPEPEPEPALIPNERGDTTPIQDAPAEAVAPPPPEPDLEETHPELPVMEVEAEGGPPPMPEARDEADYDEFDDESLEAADDTQPAVHVALSQMPADADPTLVAEAVLAFSRRQAKGHRTPTQGAWFAELFGSDFLVTDPVRSGRTTDLEVGLVEESLGVAAGGRILDLCCGYGRHTVPMADKGYEMVGLDLSLDMLRHALARAQAKNLSIKFVHGDIRDLNFEEVFDGAYCLDTSFGFFTEHENIAVLSGIFAALKRGGRFMLDVVNRDYIVNDIPMRNWWEGDGCLVQEDIEFDHTTSRLETKRFVVFADGMQREFNISIRLYALHELLQMVRLVGFQVLQVSGSVHSRGSYFGAESARLMVLCEKPDA